MILAWILVLSVLAVILLTNLFYRFKSISILLASTILGLLLPFGSFVAAYNFTGNYQDSKAQGDRVIVVLGAGIKNDTPTEILKRRLETAQQIYSQTGEKIIVTGDNSQQYHNEPRVMKNYLIRLGVAASDITEDFGGRRTMDSCFRVKNFFDVNKIILVSQTFHLPRAKFLCESVGLAVQTKAAADTGSSTIILGYLRELPASWAALLDSLYFVPQVGSNGNEQIK